MTGIDRDRAPPTSPGTDELFEAGMHQLRTPLHSLAGFAEMLLVRGERLDTVARRRAVEAIARNAARAARTVADIEAAAADGARPVHTTVVDLAFLVEEIVRDIGLAAGTHIEVSDDLEVWCDADHLAEILSNLLVNAHHHGSPPVTVAATGSDETVEIAVWDDGGGLPPGIGEHLFAWGARGTSEMPGAGLGLSIARQLAELNGGSLVYGGGRFVLSLPADAETAGRRRVHAGAEQLRLFRGRFDHGTGRRRERRADTARLGAAAAGGDRREVDPPGPHVPGTVGTPAARRPKIEEIELHREGGAVSARTELSLGDVRVEGAAEGDATLAGTMEIVAHAALRAVEQAVAGATRLELEDLTFERVEGGHVAVRVRAVLQGEDQTLIGVAMIRGDHHAAAVKATLAAVNRRLGPLLGNPAG